MRSCCWVRTGSRAQSLCAGLFYRGTAAVNVGVTHCRRANVVKFLHTIVYEELNVNMNRSGSLCPCWYWCYNESNGHDGSLQELTLSRFEVFYLPSAALFHLLLLFYGWRAWIVRSNICIRLSYFGCFFLPLFRKEGRKLLFFRTIKGSLVVEMRERRVLLLFPLTLYMTSLRHVLCVLSIAVCLPFTILFEWSKSRRLLHNMFAIILKAGGNVASVKTGKTTNISKKLFFFFTHFILWVLNCCMQPWGLVG